MTQPLWGAVVESQGNSRDQVLPRGGYVPAETATACQHTRLTLEGWLSRTGGGLLGTGCELGLPGGSRALFGESGFPEGTEGHEQTGKDPSGVGAGVEEGVMEGRERREFLPETSVTHFRLCLDLWVQANHKVPSFFPASQSS